MRFLGRCVVGVLLALVAAGGAAGHEGPHERPVATGPIDPGQSFPFLAVSGAGGHFHALLLLPDLKTFFVGTHLGLFRSEDDGLTWRLAAAQFGGDDVHALAWDSRSDVVYAATHGHGLLISRDRGTRWTSHASGLPSRDLHALALDPERPRILYVWVNGYGLFRSEDAGDHWTRLTGPEVLAGVESLAVHPRDPRRLYAGTANGVWVSEDGGREWRLPAAALPHRTAGVAVLAGRPDLVFAATLEGAFVGGADGTGWKPLPSHPAWWGAITAFGFAPDRPGLVFVVSHEGVVAVLSLTGGGWVPAAEFLSATRAAPRS